MLLGGAYSLRFQAALLGMLLMAVGMGVGRFLYTALMPAMLEQGALTFSQSSTLASVNYFGYLAGCSILTAAVPRNRRVLGNGLLLCLLATAACVFLMGTTEHYGLMLIVRGLAGVLSAGALILGAQYVLGTSSHPAVIGFFFGGVGVGVVLGNEFVVGLGRWFHLSAASIWMFSGVAVLVLIALALPGWVKLRSAPPDIVLSPRAGSMGKTVPWGVLVAAYGIAGFGYIISMTYVPVIVRTLLGDSLLVPHVWSIVGLAVIPSCFFWIAVGHRWSVLNALIVNMAVQGAGVLLSAFSDRLAAQTLSALLVGSTFMGTVSLALPLARALPFPKGTNQIALMTAVYGIGQIVGPLLVDHVFGGSPGILRAQVWAGGLLLGAAALLWGARGKSGAFAL